MENGPVEITERSDRGFHQYGSAVVDSYRGEVSVFESSSAEGPHVWLSVTDATWNKRPTPGQASAHLNEEQARAVIARLQAWLGEIHERWGVDPVEATR